MEISGNGAIHRGWAESMKVAVIIPTTQKELAMAHMVKEGVVASTYKNAEVFIINEGKERSEQRNIGIDKAKKEKADYIMYLDSDQFVSAELIEECVDLMKAGFHALYIPEKITTPGFFAKVRNYERSFYTSTPVDCVRFMRMGSCPYFNTELNGPEDADHDRRVNGFRATTKNAISHFDQIGFIEYFKKKSYYSKSMRAYKTLHPDDKVLDWKYRCFWIFIEDGKWKNILKHPLLFSCVVGIIIARAFIYLKNK
jgi:hypothetical protein